jgi:HEAT repeat protein
LQRALREVFARLGDEAVSALLAREAFPDLAELIHSGKAPGAVPALVRDLAHAEEEVRRRAAAALAHLREDVLRPTLPALLQAAQDRSAAVRLHAALTLAEVPSQRDLARALLLELVMKHPQDQEQAVRALCRIGVPADQAPALLERGFQGPNEVMLQLYLRAAPDALTPLGAMLDHSEPSRRVVAGQLLRQLGPAGLAMLGHAVAHAGPQGRRLAIEILRDEGHMPHGCDRMPTSAVAALRQTLTDPDPTLADHAAVALTFLGHGNAAITAVLRGRIAAGEPEMRCLAMAALAHLGKQGRDSLPALLHCCGHEPDRDILRQAIQTVSAIAASCPEEQPAALRVLLPLVGADSDVNLAVLFALSSLDSQRVKPLIPRALEAVLDQGGLTVETLPVGIQSLLGPELLPVVGRYLKSPDPEKQERGIGLLRHVQGAGVEMVPLLRQGLNDSSPAVRRLTHETLRSRKDASVAVPLLLSHLECEPAARRVLSLRTLAAIGPPAREALPALARQLVHANAAVRRAALEALLKVADGAVEAYPELTELLKDGSAVIRHLAVLCLARSTQPLPGLLHALDDTATEVQSAALASLAGLPRLPAEAMPLLLARLKDASSETRIGAARALARLGERGGPAVSALTAALYDTDADVRTAAAQALGALGPPARAAEAELKALRRDRHEPVRRAAAEALAKLGS